MRPSDHPAVPLYGAGGPLDQGQRPVRSQRGRPFAVGDPSRANWISTFASAARFLEFRMLKIGPAPIRALPTPVSAVGKRNFPGQRQRPRNGPCNSMGRLQRQNACTNRRQFGAIRTEPGNLRLRRTAWWGWEDSNFQPNGYCRDTSEPGLASLIYRRSGRGSCTRCSVFLRLLVCIT